MCRPQKEPLRALSQQERCELERLTRSQREPAGHVARARALLAIAEGESFTAAAQAAGRRSGDGVAKLVRRFNILGLSAIAGRPLPGRLPTYDEQARERILAKRAAIRTRPRTERRPGRSPPCSGRCAARPTDWPKVSTYTIRTVLGQAGARFGRTRSRCPTGTALRKRKSGMVEVVDPDAAAKKS